MAEIINLKRARKAKARRGQDEDAAANRAKFGTPKAERSRVAKLRDGDRKKIEAHKLDGENG